MKGRRSRRPSVRRAAIAFTRGFIATALIETLQDRSPGAPPPARKVLRRALQGGVALAAGTLAAGAIDRRDLAAAAGAILAGAAGLVAAETLLRSHPDDDNKEIGRGQEEAEA